MSDLKGQIWMDGSFCDWKDANIHILTHTMHYGTGVFEGVRAYESIDGPAIFRLKDHTDRLYESADLVGMNIPFSKEELMQAQCDSVTKNNLKKIIFSSSAGVYGNSNSSNLTEDSELKPINPYAESKYKIENFLIEISKKDKVDYTILRYFNVAGADKSNRSGLIAKSSSNLIKVLCEVATNKREKIIINGDDYKTKDGTAIRDFIHVTDIADMHVLAANNLIKKPFGLYS